MFPRTSACSQHLQQLFHSLHCTRTFEVYLIFINTNVLVKHMLLLSLPLLLPLNSVMLSLLSTLEALLDLSIDSCNTDGTGASPTVVVLETTNYSVCMPYFSCRSQNCQPGSTNRQTDKRHRHKHTDNLAYYQTRQEDRQINR